MSMTMKPLLITSVDTDQNNLMTMTNVSLHIPWEPSWGVY